MLGVADAARYQSGEDQTSEEEKAYQAAKYHEIIEILLSAGYFRTRIAGLSEFDKVRRYPYLMVGSTPCVNRHTRLMPRWWVVCVGASHRVGKILTWISCFKRIRPLGSGSSCQKPLSWSSVRCM